MKTIRGGVGGLVLTGAGVFGVLAVAGPQTPEVRPAAKPATVAVKPSELKGYPDVKEILKQAKALILELPEGTERDQLLKDASRAQAWDGDGQAAEATANAIGDSDLREDARLDAFVLSADFADANAAILRAKSHKKDPNHALAWMAQVAVDLGNFETATKAANEIEADRPKQFATRSFTFHYIAKQQAKRGLVPDALKTLVKIESNEYQLEALAAIAVAEAASGDVEGGLRRAMTIGSRAKYGDSHKSAVVVQIAKAIAKAGDRTGAEKLLAKEFEEVLGRTKSSVRTADLGEIAVAQATVGDTSEALKSLKRANSVKVDEAGRREKFIRLFSADVAEELAKTGAAKEAIALIDSEKDAREKAEGYARIALQQHLRGDHAGSETTMARTVEITAELAANAGDEKITISFLAKDIAGIQSKMGDLIGAVQTLGYVQDNSKPDASYLLARNHAQYADSTAALAWAKKQAPKAAKANCMLAVANGIIEKNKQANKEQPSVPASNP